MTGWRIEDLDSELLIGISVVFWIRNGLERRNNVLTQRERPESVIAHAYMRNVYLHQQPRPRALDKLRHLEREYLLGSPACGTGQRSNGVLVQGNVY